MFYYYLTIEGIENTYLVKNTTRKNYKEILANFYRNHSEFCGKKVCIDCHYKNNVKWYS